MNFCSNCGNFYNVTKEIKVTGIDTDKKQTGGARGKNKKNKNIIEQNDLTGINIMVKEAVKNNRPFVPSNMTYGRIESNINFQKLDADDKEKAINTIEDNLSKQQKKIFKSAKIAKESQEKDDEPKNIAFFICRSCKNFEKIKKKTVIYSQTYNESKSGIVLESSSIDHRSMSKHHALSHSKAYKCPNKKCVTHKDPSKKDMVKYREKTGYRTTFVCKACLTKF